MKKHFAQYTGLIIATTFVFGNFIACGSKMYQVSMEGDTNRGRTLGGTNQALSSGDSYPGIHAPGGWHKLPIPYKFSANLTAPQRDGLLAAMKTWEMAVGKKLFEVAGNDPKKGDSFSDLYSSLNDTTNGYYQDDDWSKTGKSEMVLATAIWDNVGRDQFTIQTADLRFNTQHYIIGDSFTLASTPEKEVVDMESLALHELGHLLGLAHVPEETDAYSIMNPTLYIGEGLANRKISKNDIELIQRIYGCENEACDVDELYSQLEQVDMEVDETEEYTH